MAYPFRPKGVLALSLSKGSLWGSLSLYRGSLSALSLYSLSLAYSLSYSLGPPNDSFSLSQLMAVSISRCLSLSLRGDIRTFRSGCEFPSSSSPTVTTII